MQIIRLPVSIFSFMKLTPLQYICGCWKAPEFVIFFVLFVFLNSVDFNFKKIINDRLQMTVYNFTLKFAIENENRVLVYFSIIANMVKYIIIYLIWNILSINKIKGALSNYGAIASYFWVISLLIYFVWMKTRVIFRLT